MVVVMVILLGMVVLQPFLEHQILVQELVLVVQVHNHQVEHLGVVQLLLVLYQQVVMQVELVEMVEEVEEVVIMVVVVEVLVQVVEVVLPTYKI